MEVHTNPKTVTFVGIDPGMDGGVVLINGDSQILSMARFDGRDPCITVRHALRDNNLSPENSTIALEKVHAFPSQGIASAFNFGAGWGALRGLIYALGYVEHLYSPQEWQKLLPHADTGKGRILEYVRQRRLEEAFIFPKCRVMHSGCVDAFGIADYHRKIILGSIARPKTVRPGKKRVKRAMRF